MQKEDAPPPATLTQERLIKPPLRRWSDALKRLAIAFGSFAAVVIAIVTLLSKLNPSILSHGLDTFFGWPLALQSLVIVGVLVVIGAAAGGKQIYHDFQNKQQEEIIRRGTQTALKNTIAPDLRTIPPWLARISGLLERLLSIVIDHDNGNQRVPSSDVHRNDAPVASRNEGGTEDARKPHDDVQLTPPDIFIGREIELTWLKERIVSHNRDRDTTVIIGISGIGKTALASKAIDQIKGEHFSDGIARVHCAGMHEHVTVVRHILERVDPKRRLPPTLSLDILRQVSEELLAGKDILIVLDGVEPDIPLGEVVRALRTEQRSAHILITTTKTPSVNVAPIESQLHLSPLDKAVNSDGTATDEALELFARYAGKASAEELGERQTAASEIVEALERHTYALQLMGAYMQGQLDIMFGVAAEVKRLKEGVVSPGLEGVLKPVWVALTKVVSELPVEARTLLFAFVGAFNGTEAGRRATRTLGQALGLRDVDDAIHTLIRSELMESFETQTMPVRSDRHRLRIHTLLRGYIFISRHITEPEWEALRAQARDTVAGFYASYIKQYDQRDPSRSTQRALSPDERNITYAIEWAISHNQHENVVAIAHGMRRFWHDRWLNDMSLRYLPTAVESAILLADRAKQVKNKTEEEAQREYAADLAFTLGRVYRRTGSLTKAEPLFQQDLAFRRQHHQYAAQAEALHQLAQLERSRGRMRAGLCYCRKGLAVVRRRLPRNGRHDTQEAKDLIQAQGVLIAQKGRIERSLGNLDTADKLFAEASRLFEQTGDILELGVALGYRGRIARVLGHLEEAQVYFARSNDLARQVYDFRGQGVIATQLGRIARIHGDRDGSEKAFIEGLNKARQVMDRQAEAINLNYLGRIANSRGDTLQAEEYFNQSLRIAREIGDRLDEGVNLGYLGRIACARNLLSLARAYFNESLDILQEVKDRRGQALTLAHLALVDIESHHFIWARWRLWRSLRLIRLVGDKRSEGTILLFHGQLDYAKGNMVAAHRHLSASLERAQALGDASGVAEAQQWLDKIAAVSGNTAHR